MLHGHYQQLISRTDETRKNWNEHEMLKMFSQKPQNAHKSMNAKLKKINNNTCHVESVVRAEMCHNYRPTMSGKCFSAWSIKYFNKCSYEKTINEKYDYIRTPLGKEMRKESNKVIKNVELKTNKSQGRNTPVQARGITQGKHPADKDRAAATRWFFWFCASPTAAWSSYKSSLFRLDASSVNQLQIHIQHAGYTHRFALLHGRLRLGHAPTQSRGEAEGRCVDWAAAIQSAKRAAFSFGWRLQQGQERQGCVGSGTGARLDQREQTSRVRCGRQIWTASGWTLGQQRAFMGRRWHLQI